MKTKRTIRYRRFAPGKMNKTKALPADAAVKGYVPQTLALAAASLQEMMNAYKLVYVKLNIGSFGKPKPFSRRYGLGPSGG